MAEQTALPPGEGLESERLARKLRRAAIRERREKVWTLHLSGAGTYQIARVLRLTMTTVDKYIERGEKIAERRHAKTLYAMRALELERLDKLIQALWDKRQDPRTNAVIQQAIAERARLLGLYAPTRVVADVRQQVEQGPKFDAGRLSTEKLRQLQGLLEEGIVQEDAIDVTPAKDKKVVALPAKGEDAA